MKLYKDGSKLLGFAALAAVANSLALTSASAALLAYSGFSGIANGTVEGAADGVGWGTNWSTQNTTNFYSVANSNPLTYGNLLTSAGGEYVSGGNAFTSFGRRIDNVAGGVFDTAGYLSTPFNQSDVDQGGVLWASTLIRRDGNGNLSFGFSGGTNTSWQQAQAGDLRVSSNSGGAWTLGDGSASSVTSVSPVNGTTQLLVLRFDMNGTNSTAHLWVNPAQNLLGGADPDTSTAQASLLGLDAAAIEFRNVAIYLGSGTNQGSADEIRIGQTFADVTPIPEPGVFAALFGLAVVGLAILRRRK